MQVSLKSCIKNGLINGISSSSRIGSAKNIDDNESMYYFQKNLKTLGIEDELKRQGIKEGDLVKILNWTFEWYE